MASTLKIISSMATKKLLAELVAQYQQAHPGQAIETEAVGGVDAAKRVAAGEAFDLVVLASDALERLAEAGRLAPGSRADIVRSGISVAVRAGAPTPAIATEDDVRRAVLAARSLSYSTGPSGVYLVKLFERWGIADTVKERVVQARPGVPVGSLVASGEVELGFQQFSELMHLSGITVLGPLPPAIQTITTFSGALAASATQPDAARALLAFLASPASAPTKQRNGMEPA